MIRLFQKCVEAGLFKVVVARERVEDAFVVHHNKGNTVGERPLLVGAIFEQRNAALKESSVGRNDLDATILKQCLVERDKIIAVL